MIGHAPARPSRTAVCPWSAGSATLRGTGPERMSDQPRRHADVPNASAPGALAVGRERYAQRVWAEAYRCLVEADRSSPLGAEDLELLAMSAYLVGRDHDYLEALERAHRAHLEATRDVRAARCAFWLGLR